MERVAVSSKRGRRTSPRIGLAAAVEYVEEIGRDAMAVHEQQLLRHATSRFAAIPGVLIVGNAKDKAVVLSFVVEDPAMSALDVGTQLDLDGIAIRTGHHCCQPLMERLRIAGTARASFAMYNTIDEVDALADSLERIVAGAKPRAVVALNGVYVYPEAMAASPQGAADEIAEFFDAVDDWPEKYQYLIDIGAKLLPMPAAAPARVQSRAGLSEHRTCTHARKPGTADVVEFLADSDADIVRGELALLQRLYCGQPAPQVLAFDIHEFMQRVGLDKNLTQGRRNGLAEMVKRVQRFAADIAAK